MNVVKGHELHVSAPDQVGLLSNIAGRCRDAGVDILGICAYRRDSTAWIVLHTSNPFKAAEMMTDLRVIWQEVIVIECPGRIGMLHEIAGKLSAAGINILYCYGTVGEGQNTKLVMDTTHNDRAIETLTR